MSIHISVESIQGKQRKDIVKEIQQLLECQQCFYDVICHFRLLEKFQRLWIDLEQDALFSSGLGQSLRSIAQRWSGQAESPMGLRVINERINQIALLNREDARTTHYPETPYCAI